MDRPKVGHWKQGLLSLGAVVLFGCGDSSPTSLPQSDFTEEPRRLAAAPAAQPIQFIEAAAEPLSGESGQPDEAGRPEEAGQPADGAPPVLRVEVPSAEAMVPGADATPQPAFEILILSPPQAAEETQPAETLSSDAVDDIRPLEADTDAPSAKFALPRGVANGPLPPVTDAPPIVVRSNRQPRPLPSSGRWQSPLPVPHKGSAAMVTVNGRAKALVANGCQLGERGAVFSARTQFIQALRLIAESLDLEQETDVHTRSLTAGLTALREVRDFQAKRSSLEAGVDLARVVSGHRTPVLKQTSPVPVTAVAAQQRYLNFAHEQLTVAAGQQPAASAALYGLGRVAAVASAQNGSAPLADVGQAMVYYQAALMADARNFLAANELGVLLAEHGRLELARDMFAHCVSIRPHPVAWQNLAIMYERLGQPESAASARSHIATQSEAGMAVANLNLKLLDPETFAQTRSASDGPAMPQQAGAATTPNNNGPAPAAATPGGRTLRR